MDSSSALCTFGGALFISSASKRFVNTGPLLNSNSLLLTLKINPPSISRGSISGVNCILLNSRPRHLANDFASRVFETPGAPSSIACPCASRDTSRSSASWFLPSTTFDISFISSSLASFHHLFLWETPPSFFISSVIALFASVSFFCPPYLSASYVLRQDSISFQSTSTPFSLSFRKNSLHVILVNPLLS